VIKQNKLLLPVLVFLITALMLVIVQIKVDTPIILLERFFKGGGWFEIPLISFYGAVVIFHMQDQYKVPKWRRLSWVIFSIVFFSQLFIGIAGIEECLMTGKLHLPIPSMIMVGPVYRGEISFMTILFLSTIILSGPAWCSHLCYFGAFDGAAASLESREKPLKNKMGFKHAFILILVVIIIILRILRIAPLYATIGGLLFGTIGLVLILFFSSRKGKMIHCIYYCPIGTIVNYLKFINPFRLRINTNCTFCSHCSDVCKYDALSMGDIRRKKPGLTCTLCGDCLQVCETNSIYYKLFNLKPETARNIYLVLTICLHTIFLALARI